MLGLSLGTRLSPIALGVTVWLGLVTGCNESSRYARDGGSANAGKGDGGSAAARSDGGLEHDAAGAAGTAGAADEVDHLTDGVVGSTCSVDADCGDGSCRLQERITKTQYPGGYCTGRCAEDADCGARGLCTPGFLGSPGSCALRCDSDTDCDRDGYRCRVSLDVGRCVPGPDPLPDHVVGNACTSDDDCGGSAKTCAAVLARVDARGGYCSQACAVDADCGAGGTCISGLNGITLSTGTCYAACMLPGACRDGYSCHSLTGNASDAHGVCSPDQPSDDDAGAF